MSKHAFRVVGLALALGAAGAAFGQARTPMGAEAGANAAGTIPAWTGGIVKPQPGHVAGGHYAWYTGESPEDDSLPGRPAPGVYLVPWRADAGAGGVKRVLGDSLGNASRPMLARLDRGTLVGVLGASAGGPARKVLALLILELEGEISPDRFIPWAWTFLN